MVIIYSCIKTNKYKKFILGNMFIDFKNNIVIVIIKSIWGKST